MILICESMKKHTTFLEDVVKKANVFSKSDLAKMCQAEIGGKVTHQLLLFKVVAIVSHHGGLRVIVCFILTTASKLKCPMFDFYSFQNDLGT